MGIGVVITILSAVLLVGLLWMFFSWNYLKEVDRRVDSEWRSIVDGLRKRQDLLPNLVETVRSYSSHQEEILEEVIDVRAKAMGLKELNGLKIELEYKLSELINRIVDFGRTMQGLSLDTNFLELRKEIADLEMSIESHSLHYNSMVRDYNDLTEKIWLKPWVKILGYKPKNIFEMEV